MQILTRIVTVVRMEVLKKGEEKVKMAGDDNKRPDPETDERVTEK